MFMLSEKLISYFLYIGQMGERCSCRWIDKPNFQTIQFEYMQREDVCNLSQRLLARYTLRYDLYILVKCLSYNIKQYDWQDKRLCLSAFLPSGLGALIRLIIDRLPKNYPERGGFGIFTMKPLFLFLAVFLRSYGRRRQRQIVTCRG